MRKRRLLRVGLVVAGLVLVGLGVHVWVLKSSKGNVTLTISCDEREYKFGDAVPVGFSVTNRSESSFAHSRHWYQRIPYLGAKFRDRFPSYRVTLIAIQEDGTRCVRRWWGNLQGLDYQLAARVPGLAPGESDEGEVILNEEVVLSKPGTYTVVGCLMLQRDIEFRWENLAVSAPIEIKVEPRRDKEMEAHIKELVQDVKTRGRGAYDAIDRLLYVRDKRTVPTLVDLAYTGEGEVPVGDGWIYYLPLDDEIKDILLKSAKERGIRDATFKALVRYCTEAELKELTTALLQSEEPNCVVGGAVMTSEYPDDSQTERLIELAQDFESEAQFLAISALVCNRTQKGVKTLRMLLDGSDEDVRDYARSSIGVGYFPLPGYRRACEGIEKRELMHIVADPDSPQRWDAMQELLYTMDYRDFRLVKHLADGREENAVIKNPSKTGKLIAISCRVRIKRCGML